MNKHWVMGWALVLLLALGCSEEAPSGPTTADLERERAALAAKLEKDKKRNKKRSKSYSEPRVVEESKGDRKGSFAAMDETYRYDREGKRDPFAPFRLDAPVAEEGDPGGPLEQYELEQLEVVALVWDSRAPRAMVSDPSGSTYTVQVGSRMGKNDGKVIHIGDNLVLVKETYVDYAGEQTTKDVELRVRRIQGG